MRRRSERSLMPTATSARSQSQAGRQADRRHRGRGDRPPRRAGAPRGGQRGAAAAPRWGPTRSPSVEPKAQWNCCAAFSAHGDRRLRRRSRGLCRRRQAGWRQHPPWRSSRRRAIDSARARPSSHAGNDHGGRRGLLRRTVVGPVAVACGAPKTRGSSPSAAATWSCREAAGLVSETSTPSPSRPPFLGAHITPTMTVGC